MATVMDQSPGDEKFNQLIKEGKRQYHAGKLNECLNSFRCALKLHYNEKLQSRILKIEEILKQQDDDSSDDDESDRMVHVGNGFYLHHGLYDKLFLHQREGVLFLWDLFKKKKGGVLGDDMGLGKTIQVIALLSGLFDAGKITSVLIVAPVAVIVNWTKELESWAPGISVYEFHSQSKRDRERALSAIRRRGGVCITSYGIVVNNAVQLAEDNGRDYIWDYVILDEGHKIKNPANKCAKGVHGIRARNRLVLTGTPIMNNLKELWALFDFVHEGQLLGSAKTFSMDYETPIMTCRQKDATAGQQRLGHEMSQSLKSLIAPYFLRRTKGDVGIMEAKVAGGKAVKGQAPLMPTLTRKNDLVVWLYLSDIQKQIYSDFLQLPSVRELLNTTKSPLVALTVLKKICDHPRLMTNRNCFELGLEIPSGVDIDSLDAAVAADPSLFDIGHVSDKNLINESGKVKFVMELLENLRADNHRCLVFSSSRRMLDIVEKVMKNRGHKMCRLDGRIRSKDDREKIIERFMTDQSYSSFLLTTQVGGVGLTLTAADRVVVIDPSWNPATDSQAVDRAFRIGQTKNVVVYRLITCGTIEEKIYRRQIFKDSVNKQTTGDSENPFRYFTKQELHELFELGDTTRSETQVQLAELHRGMRKTDTSLDEHIAYLYAQDIFGVSDHDLMFEVQAAKIVEGAADVDDVGDVRNRVTQAVERLNKESKENELYALEHGKYRPNADEFERRFGSKKPTGTVRGKSKVDNDDTTSKTEGVMYVVNTDDEESPPIRKTDHHHIQRIVDSDEDVEMKSTDLFVGQFEPDASSTFIGSGQLDDTISQLRLTDIKHNGRKSDHAMDNHRRRSSVLDNDRFVLSSPVHQPYAVKREELNISLNPDEPLVSCETLNNTSLYVAQPEVNEQSISAHRSEDIHRSDRLSSSFGVSKQKRRSSVLPPLSSFMGQNVEETAELQDDIVDGGSAHSSKEWKGNAELPLQSDISLPTETTNEAEDDEKGEDSEEEMAKQKKWTELMQRCKSLYKQNNFAEAYHCGCAAMKIHNENQKANEFVEKIRFIVYKDEDDKDETQNTPSVMDADGTTYSCQTKSQEVNNDNDVDETNDDNDEANDSDDDDSSFEMTEEDEEKYIKLLADAKKFYNERKYQTSLEKVEEAMEMFNEDERVIAFRDKVKALILSAAD